MLWVLSLQRDSSIQSQNLCETESFPLQNLSCKCKDWIFGDLGATKQPKKKTVIECKNSMLQYRKRDTWFCEVGIWRRRRREWRRKHWRLDSWKDETWREPQKLKPSQTYFLCFFFFFFSFFSCYKIKIDSAIHIHSLFFFFFYFFLNSFFFEKGVNETWLNYCH